MAPSSLRPIFSPARVPTSKRAAFARPLPEKFVRNENAGPGKSKTTAIHDFRGFRTITVFPSRNRAVSLIRTGIEIPRGAMDVMIKPAFF